jgi:hypothetical protein
MYVVLCLMAHLASAAPTATMDVPAASWEAPARAQSASVADLDGPSTQPVAQGYGYGEGGGYGYGRRRRLSGPGLIVGGAVLTGVGAVILATAPSSGWNEQDTPHRAGSAAGVVFLVGGILMMGCGLVLTMSDQ